MDREAIANALQGKRITNRGMLVPRVEYDDGSQGWGVPGLIMEPVEAWQRLQAGAGDNLARMQQGLPFDPQSAGDAFAVTGAAALGSVAAPKPSGAYVTSGAPMKPTHLPMDEASRLARARQMGFDTDTTWYHATSKDFDEFADAVPWQLRNAGTDNDVPATFFTSKPSVAETYLNKQWVNDASPASEGLIGSVEDGVKTVYGTGDRILPTHVRTPDEYTVWQMGGGAYDREFVERALKEAKAEGEKMVLFKDMRDPGLRSLGRAQISDILAVFDPKDIRSKFAAFDPAKSDSADLLAANPKEAAALSAAVQGEKQGLRFDIPNFSPTTGQARVSVMSGPDEIGHGLFYDLKSARGPDAPDALMLRNVAINKDYQRQGIATAMQREMERRSGKKVVPDDSQLSAAEYARWMKIDPDAVASYVDVGNGQFMPSRSGQAQKSLTTNRGTQSDQSLIEALRTYLERNTLPEDTY